MRSFYFSSPVRELLCRDGWRPNRRININHFENIISSDDGRVSTQIKDNKFIIIGNSIALSILGDSLNNFFDKESKKYDHFHIDYYDGNDVLNPTNISLIFMCL